MIVDHIRKMDGRIFFKGDEVQDERARFFIGLINDSGGLCFIDKSKPFKRLVGDNEPFAKAIDQGNYGAAYTSLKHVENKDA
jgi:hypothetical protein